ncbi:putative cyclase [Auriscalpium vulgare]|uniref:Cyclase n=1 Tax=Auriscalpium vulgare TaxID=40419 RepID=A0ACB8RN89_9AGAM|nr:putative cyclase [Auriscalpium vulgare]
MELIDLSHSFDASVPVYPGDPPFHCIQFCTIPTDGFSVHKLETSSHAGTHIDAPSHFFANLASIDQLPLSIFVLPALVVDVSHKKARERIVWDDVRAYESRLAGGIAVLFYTGWSRFWEDKNGRYFDHPWIDADVARRLLARGVKIIGSDTMSPDQSPIVDTGFGVHEAVLGAGLVIAENLTNLGRLRELQEAAPESTWMVNLAPLRIAGCDGSPVRAFAWEAK